MANLQRSTIIPGPSRRFARKPAKQAVWYRQRVTIPKTLNGYDLTGVDISFEFIATANGPMPEIIYFDGRRVALGEDLEQIPLFDHAKPGQSILVAVKLLPTVDDKEFRGAQMHISFAANRPNPLDAATEIVSAANLLPALAPNSSSREGRTRQSHRADRSARTRSSTASSLRRITSRCPDDTAHIESRPQASKLSPHRQLAHRRSVALALDRNRRHCEAHLLERRATHERISHLHLHAVSRCL